ncbi:Uncharacterised protein [Cedecea neteri]|uniref:Uncharacterized protein n=1 Tax=Cedecea neteri TaxID=158822 RepID=A0A2X3IHM7_9ENTR|nr:Uncharacterised protein [Cedecea neteri]
MLGRIGMVLNNATTATQAFAHAYKLGARKRRRQSWAMLKY